MIGYVAEGTVVKDVTAVPCTCGELFQGTLGGKPCLVSCPIDIYSTSEILDSRRDFSNELDRKTRLALEWIVSRVGQEVLIRVKKSLPAGRGYGTSTADIGAVLYAASRAFDLGLTPQEAARAAVQIEPSDSTIFPGLALFDHRCGHFYQLLGQPPPGHLVILDGGGAVDSEAFNAHDWRLELARMAAEHRRAYRLLLEGIAARDLSAIGEASTLSAVCHQVILFNPLVDLAVLLAKETCAAGICRAHSGTIVGLIYPVDFDGDAVREYLFRRVPLGVNIRQASLVGGGARYLSLTKSRGERLRSGVV